MANPDGGGNFKKSFAISCLKGLEPMGVVGVTYNAVHQVLNYVLSNACAASPECSSQAIGSVIFAVALLGIEGVRVVRAIKRVG